MSKKCSSNAGTCPVRRYFSVTSLIGVVVVTACLIWTYRELTVRHLIEHESRSNVDLTRALSNDIWSTYQTFVTESRGRSRDALLADPALHRLQTEVLEKMRGLKVVKIKITTLTDSPCTRPTSARSARTRARTEAF